MGKIELFLFVLSLVYSLKYLIQFVMVIKQDNPPPFKITIPEQVILYCSVAYVFTYIIGLFLW
jgi:hypothetical protein